MRRYGFTVSHPPGNKSLAASLSTEGRMMTSSPFCQFAGVPTLCFSVSWQESSTRSSSSKLRPVLLGYLRLIFTFLSGPRRYPVLTVWLSAAVLPSEESPVEAGSMS